MIDKRLLELHSFVSKEQDDVDRGRKGAGETWGDEARAALSGYFKSLLSQMSTELPVDEVIFSFVQHSPLVALQSPIDSPAPWPVSIMGGIEASLRNPSDHTRPVADWLIATALFDALVSRGRPLTDGVHVARMLADNSTRVRAFAERVAAASNEEIDVVVASMRLFIQDECSHPERHLLERRLSQDNSSALEPAIKGWATETDVVAVWNTREWMGFDMVSDRLGMLMPLAAAKPADFLPLMEEIQPFPLQESSLHWRAISMNLNLVLEMLENAPAIIDQQSGLWNRKVVAPLLLRTAFGVIRELSTHRQDNGDSLADDNELAGIAQTIIERALKRPDGAHLVSSWMRHQVHAAASRIPDPTFEAVFNASLAAFAKANIGVADVYPSMATEFPKWGVLPDQLPDEKANAAYEQLFLAAMLVQERMQQGTGQQEPSLRPSFIALMREARNPFSLGYREVMPTWRHRVLAEIYTSEAESAKSWREDFDLFAPERRAALHYSYSREKSLMAPSLFLAGAGLSLIDLFLEADAKSPRAHQAIAIWKTVFDATRLMFTHWSLSIDSWRSVAAALFARYPDCLRTRRLFDPSKEQPEQWLTLLGGDDGLVADALANLLNNDMDAVEVFGSGPMVEEMKHRIRGYIEWEGSAGSRMLNRRVRSYLLSNFLDKPVESGAR